MGMYLVCVLAACVLARQTKLGWFAWPGVDWENECQCIVYIHSTLNQPLLKLRMSEDESFEDIS